MHIHDACNLFRNFILWIEIIVKFEAKSWPEHITDVKSLLEPFIWTAHSSSL